MDCDNAFYPWRHVNPDAVHSLVVSNDLEGLTIGLCFPFIFSPPW
jgi:hypothetical protein